MSEEGWFAYAPEAAEPPRKQAVARVWLEADEHAGPFRCERGSLGRGFEQVREGIEVPLREPSHPCPSRSAG